MVVPISYHEISEKHTSKMCHVGNVVSRRAHGREEIYSHVEHHKPFCLDRDGQWEDEYALVGEYHSEGEKYGIHSSRGSNGGPSVELCR